MDKKTVSVLSEKGVDIFPATVVDGVGFEPARCSLSKLLDTYNVSTLWPLEGNNRYAIETAIETLVENLEENQKVPGVKVGFMNSNSSYEEWEFFSGGYTFANIKGWKQVDSNVIQTLLDTVFPLSVTFSISPTLVRIGSSTQGRFSWTVTRTGTNVSAEAIKTLDGLEVSEVAGKNITLFSDTHKTDTYTFSATYQGLTKTGTAKVTYVHPVYVGLVSADTEEITAEIVQRLTNFTQASNDLTRVFPVVDNQKVCYAFPSYFGEISSIKDSNNFEYIDSYTKTTVDIDGIQYYTYLLTNATTITNFTQKWL